jgi:hypothetical protein
MPPFPEPPRISALSWGRIEVEEVGVFKDLKIYPGGAREWDWNETGTRHSPGIQTGDVEELLSRGVSVLVLGVGMLGRLKVQPDTLATLRGEGVAVHILRTKGAVGLYNELREREPVGALLHSTC